MGRYIQEKIFQGFFVVLGVLVFVFFLFQLVRFNPAYSLAGENSSEKTIQNISKELGLELPVHTQLLIYLNHISPFSLHQVTDSNHILFFDSQKYNAFQLLNISHYTIVIKVPYLGRSFQTNRLVSSLLMERIPNTLILAFSAILFSTLIGIFLGVIAALKQNSITDTICTAASVLGIALPSFFVAIIFQLVFAYLLASFTGLNLTGDLWEADPYSGENTFVFKNLILPVLALGIRPIAVITQMTRSSMLDILQSDFMRTAYAKGLSENIVVFKHGLHNALIPVVTSITGWFASLLAGAFFIEIIFQYNGIGLETINAIKTKDIPVAMGALLFTACIFVVVSIFTDILYRFIDPRIKILK